MTLREFFVDVSDFRGALNRRDMNESCNLAQTRCTLLLCLSYSKQIRF
jgi:hypothetical protein